ncbi:MAG: chromosome segregation protein ScpA, partial [Clostridia bacterium]|nr:chromosome segregation protein ScpA [Clostridia bacterium]
EDMVEKVCKYLAKTPRLSFRSVFKPEDSKPEMIATFLAILEMIKLSKIKTEYDENKKDFILLQV